MIPINYAARKSAVTNFLVIFFVSLLAIAIASYFLFNTPVDLFKNQLINFKQNNEEQKTLLGKLDTMTHNTQEIWYYDSASFSGGNLIQNASYKQELKNYTSLLDYNVAGLINDSSGYSIYNRNNIRNYLTCLEEILRYRDYYSSYQATLNEERNLDSANSKNHDIELHHSIDSLNYLIDNLRNNQYTNKIPASPSDNSKQIDDLKSQYAVLQKQLQDCENASKKAVNTNPCPACPEVTSNNTNNVSQAKALFDEGQKIYKNSTTKNNNAIEKRGMLEATLDVFNRAYSLYADNDPNKKTCSQNILIISNEIKKTFNQ